MLFKDIKVGQTYEVRSFGEIVKVKVTEKVKNKKTLPCRVRLSRNELFRLHQRLAVW